MGAAAPNPGHTFPAMGKYAKDGKGFALAPCSGRALRAKPGKGHSPLTPQPDGSGRSNGPDHPLLVFDQFTLRPARFVLCK